MVLMLGTIGLFLRSNDNDYQQRLKEVGLREAKRQGFDIVLESAQNDPTRQVEQIRAAIANAPTTKLTAILVSSVRDDVLPDVVREAAEAGHVHRRDSRPIPEPGDFRGVARPT
jgi:ABC-type sugar transport system substrate-binding protein